MMRATQTIEARLKRCQRESWAKVATKLEVTLVIVGRVWVFSVHALRDYPKLN